MNVVEENTLNLKQATIVSLNDKSELTIENGKIDIINYSINLCYIYLI